eukprot:TRINITY_DN12122_c0_g1_i2.p1 TRINITY_DN12122_c0_g1~~TRINITY_DN12122_c0_g1_i2.p1  ORF type:complete len:341 (-),score=72.66 TRINITY_DN12122_c0_g1_i2:84-1046(-)
MCIRDRVSTQSTWAIYISVCLSIFTPMALVFSMLGLVIMYWAEKRNLVRRYSVPPAMSESVMETLTKWLLVLPAFAVLFHAGYMETYFNHAKVPTERMKERIGIVIQLAAAFAFALFFLIYKVFAMRGNFFRSVPHAKDEDETTVLYDDARIMFLTDYDRENPLTAQEALKNYISYLERKRQEMKANNPHLKDLNPELLDQQLKVYHEMNDDMFSSLENYASNALKGSKVDNFLSSVKNFASKKLDSVEDKLFFQNGKGTDTSRISHEQGPAIDTSKSSGLINPAYDYNAMVRRRSTLKKNSDSYKQGQTNVPYMLNSIS